MLPVSPKPPHGYVYCPKIHPGDCFLAWWRYLWYILVPGSEYRENYPFIGTRSGELNKIALLLKYRHVKKGVKVRLCELSLQPEWVITQPIFCLFWHVRGQIVISTQINMHLHRTYQKQLVRELLTCYWYLLYKIHQYLVSILYNSNCLTPSVQKGF